MFRPIFDSCRWGRVGDFLSSVTVSKVDALLTEIENHPRSLAPFEFLTLISSPAKRYLERMARHSQRLTRQRFGDTVQLYLPIYLTNTCSNICTYCGFSYTNQMERIILNEDEIKKEICEVKKLGYDHILIVSGEDQKKAGVDYFKKMLPLFHPYFSHISIEIQPLDQEEYEILISDGLANVLVYQETYHRENYKTYHPKGKKSNFYYRLDTPDRLGLAGIHKMGLGVLLGLEDWRIDSFFCALHLDYLRKTYWKTRYSVSFPRLRPASGVDFSKQMEKKYIREEELAQLIFAYRLFEGDLEISLSTRESQKFRDHILGLGITSISAGSKTNPGGYACYPETTLQQFETDDQRSVGEVIEVIRSQGLEPVIKDWSKEFQTS